MKWGLQWRRIFVLSMFVDLCLSRTKINQNKDEMS